MITRTRKLVIGVDEAGYGPNLGPLCLGFSVWLVDSALDVPSLAQLLLPIFQPRSTDATLPWIPLGDSKKLYKTGHSLSSLSLGIAALEHLAELPSKAARPLDPLQARVLKEDWDRLNRVPWYQPNGVQADSLHPVLQERIPASLLEAGGYQLKTINCDLLALSSRAIEEATFNELVERMGNKSNLLTAVTLESIRQILHDRLESKSDFDSIEVFCDKHGGRNRYVAALSHFFLIAGLKSSMSRQLFRGIEAR